MHPITHPSFFGRSFFCPPSVPAYRRAQCDATSSKQSWRNVTIGWEGTAPIQSLVAACSYCNETQVKILPTKEREAKRQVLCMSLKCEEKFSGAPNRIESASNFEKNAISLLLAIIALLMLVEAFCRHFAPGLQGYPIKTAGGCLAWMASLGMSEAAAAGKHVKVSFLTNILGVGDRLRLAVFADLVFLLFSAASFGLGCFVLVRSLARNNPPSHPLVYAAIPVGSVLTMYRLVQRLRKGNGEDEAE